MAGSAAKLQSILAIARAEGEALGDRLRMVVLADHVRIGDLPGPDVDRVAPSKLGVATIFDALRREGQAEGAIGVVSGALVIVPDGALAALARSRGGLRCRGASCRARALAARPGLLAGSASVAKAGTGSSR